MEEAKAPKFESEQLTNAYTKITLNSRNSEQYRLAMDLEWGVNLYEAKAENNLLL